MSVSPSVEVVVQGRARDLGGFRVLRVIPALERRTVGPFVFLDHMGPVALPPGEGIDVRPHPHIGLATVTYLWEGSFVHRDSVGSELAIRPGAVNWMIAGRGVVHSERADPEVRHTGGRLHGLQAWVGLPQADEETAPSFEHHPAETIPEVRPAPGVVGRVIAGDAFGARSPVGVRSRTLYVDLRLDADAALVVPPDHVERAVYVLAGAVRVDGVFYAPGALVVLRAGVAAVVTAEEPTIAALLGGDPLDGPRHLWWNFVSSRPERLAEAADLWRADGFPVVPTDPVERIPAPAGPR